MSDIFILSIPTPLSHSINNQETMKISKSGIGWRNSPQGRKTFFRGQFRVDAYSMVDAN